MAREIGESMGKVITVMNMKGGVGKTTVCMHIGFAMVKYNFNAIAPSKKILLIDYDPQFNLSQALLPSKKYFELEKAGKTVLSILTDKSTNIDPYDIPVPGNYNPPNCSDIVTEIYRAGEHRLDLIPATLELIAIAIGTSTKHAQKMKERFGKFILEAKNITILY
jgi:chromosome partitioning protein